MKRFMGIVAVLAAAFAIWHFKLRPEPVYVSDGSDPGWVISHKTAGAEYPENTLLGFRESLKMDVDAIEIDVHVVKEGAVVLHHDPVLSSYNCFEDGDETKLIVAQMTVAELAALTCYNSKVKKPYQIDTLDALLTDYVASGTDKTLLLEVKVWDELIENNPLHVGLDIGQMHYEDRHVAERVYAVLRQYPSVKNVQFNTFSRSLLLELKAQMAAEEGFGFGLLYKGHYAPVWMAPLAFVMRKKCYDSCWAPDYAEVRQWLRDNEISTFIPNFPQIDNVLFGRGFQKHIVEQKDGLTIYPWTLNKAKDWSTYQAMNFDGILTDKPQDFLTWVE
ncbi:glycerophosphodiester phosphodiesterase [Shimia sp. Alg240-R146]|uniref:glycerophosphodiester phosphodiesterase n=1 Tax=Shimia sp. Alg240-R146 TaxID=2993449 RepID=UPI0022E7483F|nr:glycerophosphodiester phosphodiesterase family protein [Shimia sp. Alg240-R146]